LTRLTISASGDPLTFRPVTSSLIRNSKDGNIDVILLFSGTHYGIRMDGIIQQDTEGDIDDNTRSVKVNSGLLELKGEMEAGGTETAVLRGSFSSFMYFYPGIKIKGHLKLSETSHAPAVPEFEGHYHFADLLNGDSLTFRLVLEETSLRFDVAELVSGVENVIYTTALAPGVDEIFFEFDYLINGKSRIFTFTDYGELTQVKTRQWIGDLKARLGECNVVIELHNDEEELKTVSSDFIYVHYRSIFMKFDRTTDDRFIGRIRMYDDLNEPLEADWREVRSRDYSFEGNRIIENGMIRIVIKTDNPNIEIWGWNFNGVDAWEKCMTILTESDSGSESLRVQNISFEYFSIAQIKCNVNFGTSLYSFIMTRGDPYITMLDKGKFKFKFRSEKNRFAADLVAGDYNLENTFVDGSPVVRAASEETLSGFTLNDNWFSVYNNDVANEVIGWMSNAIQPNEIKIEDANPNLVYTFTYPIKGNIFGVGVLPTYPTNLVGNVPFPFVVSTQDKYVKWRANESLLSFKEVETIKRR